MMGLDDVLYFSKISHWAPSLQSDADWNDWALGKRSIEISSSSPKLEFTTPLFRRRLSQLTKMTVQVVHDSLLEGRDKDGREIFNDAKIFFTSFRGEIKREFSINEELIKEGDVLPASFSLSVFNTAPALATIAMGVKNGYTVVFPSGGNFQFSLQAAFSSLLCGREESLLFVYGDEMIPCDYGSFSCQPFAFATLVSGKKTSSPSKTLSLCELKKINSPEEFLARLILC